MTGQAWPVLLKALSNGDVTAVAPAWKDLSVGNRLYRVDSRPQLGSIPFNPAP